MEVDVNIDVWVGTDIVKEGDVSIVSHASPITDVIVTASTVNIAPIHVVNTQLYRVRCVCSEINDTVSSVQCINSYQSVDRHRGWKRTRDVHDIQMT